MTQKLYELDNRLLEFGGKVTACRPQGELFEIQLDRTAFYPEGGGQPGDQGFLGDVAVVDTLIHQGEILHLAKAAIKPGTTVRGKIDRHRRLIHSQQHTGEHIVSGLVKSLYGYDNVGFRMGSDAVTMDFSGELAEADVRKLECLANEAVWQDIPVETSFPSQETLEQLEYRSKIALSGQVRIVTIPGVDVCACCGTHVPTTARVGGIKLLSAQRHKGGTRILMLAGVRAMADSLGKDQVIRQLVAMLSAKPGEELAAVGRLADENAALKGRLAGAYRQLCALEAGAVEPTAGNLCLFREGLGPDDLRRLALAMAEKCAVAAVFCPKSPAERAEGPESAESLQYALASVAGDVGPLCKELNRRFSGRGGGSAQLAQGSVRADRRALEDFFRQ